MDQAPVPWRVLQDDDRVGPATPSAGVSVGADASDRERRGVTVHPAAWAAGIALAVGLVAVAIGLVAGGPQPVALVDTGVGAVSAEGPAPDGSNALPPSPAATIVVHVAGAVRRPGLVDLPEGARIADAIDAAGGLGPMADPERVGRELNLAERISDGQRILVPSRDDPAGTGDPGGSTQGGEAQAGSGPGTSGLVDLNHADAATLDTLPGIGPVTAAKIIAARVERPFSTLDELVQRKVVTASTLEKFRDRAVVR